MMSQPDELFLLRRWERNICNNFQNVYLCEVWNGIKQNLLSKYLWCNPSLHWNMQAIWSAFYPAQVWGCSCANMEQEENFSPTLGNTAAVPMGLFQASSNPSLQPNASPWHVSHRATDLDRGQEPGLHSAPAPIALSCTCIVLPGYCASTAISCACAVFLVAWENCTSTAQLRWCICTVPCGTAHAHPPGLWDHWSIQSNRPDQLQAALCSLGNGAWIWHKC